MKKIKYLITLLICLFMCSNVYAASSKFEPVITMDNFVTEDQITVILGFKGEEIMALKHTLSYDTDYLSLDSVGALENFEVNISEEKKEGKYKTFSIVADSDYAFKENNYAILVFNITKKLSVGKKTTLFAYGYEAAGVEKYKYIHDGRLFIMERDTASEMLYRSEDITKMTQIKYWCIAHWYVFVIILLIIGGIVAFIILVPSKRIKENRQKKIEDLISNPEEINNSNNNVSPISINADEIAKIGEEEKVVDMTNAIVVDTNPFGNEVTSKVEDVVVEQPESNNEVELDAFNMNVVTQESTQQESSLGTIPLINSQNISSQLNNVPETTVNNEQVSQVVPGETELVDQIEKKNEENLVQFQPTFFEDGNNNEEK